MTRAELVCQGVWVLGKVKVYREKPLNQIIPKVPRFCDAWLIEPLE
jgi:hypothetical protein